MKRKYLSLAIGCVLLSPVAWAQDAAPTAPQDNATQSRATTLGEVTVTARKREETLHQVPVAVTAFTADSLHKLNVEDIGNLDAQVPNLTIYAARGSSSTVTAYIRGIGQSDPLWGVDPGVGIYLDDVYIARPQGALLDVFDVERVEVLRGPQGTLFSKNTTGGAVQIRTKRPDMAEAIPAFCGRCHSDPEFMKRYNPAARVDQVQEYWTSHHGRALQRGDTRVATCIDCHGIHGVLHAGDTRSPVYPKQVAETCGRCHSDSQRMAGSTTPDGRPLPVDQQARWRHSVHAAALYDRDDLSAPTCNDSPWQPRRDAAGPRLDRLRVRAVPRPRGGRVSVERQAGGIPRPQRTPRGWLTLFGRPRPSRPSRRASDGSCV